MPSPGVLSIGHHFAELRDPRRQHGQRHRLLDIIVIALCAVIAGSDTWQEVETFARRRRDWLARFLDLDNGVPCHDTFERVFDRLDPLALQRCLLSWLTALCDGLKVGHVAIDGKTARRSGSPTRGIKALHLVSAWATEHSLTLGQIATEEKSNEITAIPELLELLDLEGAVVTIDAMGCQKDIASGIIEKKGEYVLAVKENQPHLYEDIGQAFDEALEHGEAGVDFTECRTEGVRSGRREARTCCVITNPSGLRGLGLWTKLTAICMVVCEGEINGICSSEIRYFIGSVAGTAEEYLRWVRGHWGIENSLHWVLDVCFREDDQRHWSGHSAENLAWIRKLALCLLRAEKTSQAGSINRRRHLAGWKDDYLLKVLAQIPEKSGA